MRSPSIPIMRSLLSISSSSSTSAITIPHHHHHHHHHHEFLRVLPPFKRTTLPLLPAAAASVARSHCSVPAAACRYAPMEPHPSAPGEIHVIVGPMFAGKTTALLRRIRAELASGRTAAIIKSDKDTRYGLDSAVTHDGTKMSCFALPELSMFKDKFGSQAYSEQLDVIGIDEAQFFEDLYDFCCNAAEHDGKTVVVAGLDGDYLRRRFGSVLDIIPLADSITKLTARCELCGRRAFFTLRKTNETKTELIGGAEVYMPVCRQHYIDGQVAIEATKIVLNAERSAAVGNLK